MGKRQAPDDWRLFFQLMGAWFGSFSMTFLMFCVLLGYDGGHALVPAQLVGMVSALMVASLYEGEWRETDDGYGWFPIRRGSGFDEDHPATRGAKEDDAHNPVTICPASPWGRYGEPVCRFILKRTTMTD